MRSIFLAISISLFILQASAQDFTKNYKPLKNVGNIPESFRGIMPLIDESAISEQAEASNKKTSAKSRKRFTSLTNIALKFLLQSGDLMFGDPITNYVNQVADILLKDYPEIRNKIQIYTSRYSEVNAVCLPNGIIIVNIGLIAQLENEAELAFTLAHELVHFVNKHSINSFIENSDFKRNCNNASKKIDREFAMLQYQKDLEFEADRQGYLNYFLNSGYKTSEAEAMCDVLLYGDLPIDEVEFRLDSVEDEWFVLPDRCKKSTVDPISAIEDYKDELMSHPNIKKRRERIQILIDSTRVSGKEFILPRDSFKAIRDMARFELCLVYLNEKKFFDAYYLIYILQQDFPTNIFLQQTKAEILYRINILVRDRETLTNIRSTEKQKGESQRLLYMLNGFSGDEMCIYTCRELWKVHRQLPSDKAVSFITTDCFNYLFNHTKYPLSRFIIEEPTVDDGQNNTDSVESKYDRIRKSQENSNIPDPFEWAFYSFRNDTSLRGFLKEASLTSDENTLEIKKVTFPNAGGVIKSDYMSPVSNLIIFNPFYLRDASGTNPEKRVINSLENQSKISNSILRASTESGFNVKLLDLETMNYGDVNDYNNYQQITQWINYMPEENDIEVFSSFNQAQIDSIAKYYNTRYMAFTGIISNRVTKSEYIAIKLYTCLIAFPLAPVILYCSLAPFYKTYYFFDIYDLTTGLKVYSEIRRTRSRDYPVTIDNFYFHTFNCLKKI